MRETIRERKPQTLKHTVCQTDKRLKQQVQRKSAKGCKQQWIQMSYTQEQRSKEHRQCMDATKQTYEIYGWQLKNSKFLNGINGLRAARE
jgi:hypothetical protein